MHSSAAMGKSLTLWMSSNSHLPAVNSKIKSTSIQSTEMENIVEIQGKLTKFRSSWTK